MALPGNESLIRTMSENAAISKSFFVPSCATLLAPNTLPMDGAEDKALPGGNLSADSVAKTRLGPVSNRAEPQHQNNQPGLASTA